MSDTTMILVGAMCASLLAVIDSSVGRTMATLLDAVLAGVGIAALKWMPV